MTSTTDSFCQLSSASGARLHHAKVLRGNPSELSSDWGRTGTVTLSGDKGLYSTKWDSITGPIGGFFYHFLSKHRVARKKGGWLFHPGTLSAPRRLMDSVISFDYLVYDIDNKPEDGPEQRLDEVNVRLFESGHSYFLYSSPSHRLTGVDKFRFGLPLAETFYPQGDTLERREGHFAAVYKHVAQQHGISRYDLAGENLNQAYYLPHHLRDQPWVNYLALGNLLEIPDLPVPDSKRKSPSNAAKRVSLGVNAPVSARLHRRVDNVLRKYGHRFQAADLVESLGWESVARRDGGVNIRCPNDDEHSEPGSPLNSSCAAWNPRDSPSGCALIKCQHAHCRHLTTAAMITMLLEQIEREEDVQTVLADHVAD